MYMKKLLDSDWLRVVQFKCNTSAKTVSPVQITTKISEVSPRKLGEPQMHPNVIPDVSKIPQNSLKSSEDYQTTPKTT